MGNLTDIQRKILERWFTEYELNIFDTAKTPKGELQPNIYDKIPFQLMLKSRKMIFEHQMKKGWTAAEIKTGIDNWYKAKNDRSPFDWLKAEYRPAKRLGMNELAKQLKLKRERTNELRSIKRSIASRRPQYPNHRPVKNNK